MKFRLWSDVHCDFGLPIIHPLEDDKETNLIIAGDWGTAGRPFDHLMENLCKQFKSVLFLTGNHDYWGSSIQEVDRFWFDFQNNHQNFNCLSTGFCRVNMEDNVYVVGCTLWTDCNRHDMETLRQIKKYMEPDFKFIQDFHLDPYNWIGLHDQQTEWLRNHILEIKERHQGAKILVVTHHAPHARCDPDHSYNAGFACRDMDDLIDPELINMWAFGHTHVPVDFELNGVRMISNPRGYVGFDELPSQWDDAKIYEVK